LKLDGLIKLNQLQPFAGQTDLCTKTKASREWHEWHEYFIKIY